MRKYISLLLVLVLCFGMAVTPAFASHQSFYANQTRTIGTYGYIDQQGSLWLWGDNKFAQAGQDTTEYPRWVDKPMKVMDHVVAFDRDPYSTIVLKDDGSVWTFGRDYAKEKQIMYANGAQLPSHPDPVKVLDGCIAVAVSSHESAFGALKANGDLYTWGSNIFNANGHAYHPASIPVANYEDWWRGAQVGSLIVPTLLAQNVKSFSMGNFGSYITNSGDVFYWGYESWFYTRKDDMPQEPQKVFTKADDVAMVYNAKMDPYLLNNNGDLYRWNFYKKYTSNFQPSGGIVTPKARVKVLSGVRRIVDQTLKTAATVQYEIPFYAPYVIKFDDCLYDSTGKYKLADNVNDAYMAYMQIGDGRYPAIGLVLKNDGNLYQAILSNDGTSFTSMTLIASGVALSGKPFSTIKVPAAPADTVGGFKDVHSYDWFADPVLWAVKNGITDGTAPGVFAPAKACTQAQVLTFMWRANGSPKSTIRNTFKNLPDGQWYTDAVLWAHENKIIPKDDFYQNMDLNSTCRRCDVVTYLYNEAGKPSPGSSSVAFMDVNAYYNDAVKWAYREGITDGVSNAGNQVVFGTLQDCTRAQIVTFLYRAYANK